MKLKIFAEESSCNGLNNLETEVNNWLEKNKKNILIKDKQITISLTKSLTKLVITIWYIHPLFPEPTPKPRPGRKE